MKTADHSSIHFQQHRPLLFVDHSSAGADLGQSGSNELLAAEPGIHGHQQHHIRFGQDVFYAAKGGRRVQCHHGPGTQFPDMLQRSMQMRACLHMYTQPVGSRFDECVQVPFGFLDHQVHVQGQVRRFADGPDHIGPDGYVRDKMSIHDIHVNPVRSC